MNIKLPKIVWVAAFIFSVLGVFQSLAILDYELMVLNRPYGHYWEVTIKYNDGSVDQQYTRAIPTLDNDSGQILVVSDRGQYRMDMENSYDIHITEMIK